MCRTISRPRCSKRSKRASPSWADLPTHSDRRAHSVIAVSVGHEEEVDRRLDAADHRRPAGCRDHVRRRVRIGGEVHADTELEALVELEAEQAARGRNELALLE